MITKAMKEMKLTPEAPEMSQVKSHLKQLLAYYWGRLGEGLLLAYLKQQMAAAAPKAAPNAKAAAPKAAPKAAPNAKARKRVCDKAYHKGKKQAKIAGKSPEMISYAAKLAYYHAGSKWDEDSSGSD